MARVKLYLEDYEGALDAATEALDLAGITESLRKRDCCQTAKRRLKKMRLDEENLFGWKPLLRWGSMKPRTNRGLST